MVKWILFNLFTDYIVKEMLHKNKNPKMFDLLKIFSTSAIHHSIQNFMLNQGHLPP